MRSLECLRDLAGSYPTVQGSGVRAQPQAPSDLLARDWRLDNCRKARYWAQMALADMGVISSQDSGHIGDSRDDWLFHMLQHGTSSQTLEL